jgi:hypothetical protein
MMQTTEDFFLMKHSVHRNIVLFAHFHNVNLCGWDKDKVFSYESDFKFFCVARSRDMMIAKLSTMMRGQGENKGRSSYAK